MQQPAVIVTGACGVVGTRVVQRLIEQEVPVVALTRRMPPPGHPVHHPLVRPCLLDLATASEDDLDTLFARNRPVALLHCAALVNADQCEEQRELAWAVNTAATARLARMCTRYQVHCLFVSTDYVFDGTQAPGCLYRESDTVHPLNFYGYSKWQGELAVQEACEGLTAWSICRTSVVYGSSAWSRLDFVHWLAHRLEEGKQVQIVNDQVSSPTDATDLARMLVTLALEGHSGIYHTAGDSALARYSFARLVAQYLGLDERLIVPVTSQKLQQAALRPLNAGLNVDRISAVLGTRPWSAAEGIEHSRSRAVILAAHEPVSAFATR